MRQTVHELYLCQHLLAVLAVLVHLQHHHLTSSLVGDLKREGGETEQLSILSNAPVCLSCCQNGFTKLYYGITAFEVAISQNFHIQLSTWGGEDIEIRHL